MAIEMSETKCWVDFLLYVVFFYNYMLLDPKK